MTFGEDTEARVPLEEDPFAGDVGIEIGIAPEARPERLERAQLEWHHPVALDDRSVAQLPGLADERGTSGSSRAPGRS